MAALAFAVKPEENASTPVKKHKGNILFFHHLGTKSHVILLSALAEGLASHGYNVTAVWFTKMSQKDTSNYTQRIITDRLVIIHKRTL